MVLNATSIPLFDRSFGGLPPVPFASKGLLSVVQSQASEAGFAVKRLTCDDAQIVYRVYAGGLVVVLATSESTASDGMLLGRVDAIHSAFSFLVGGPALARMPTLKGMRPVEAAKRSLRTAGALVGEMLVGEREDSSFQVLLDYPEVAPLPESLVEAQAAMALLGEAVESRHAAVYVRHRLCACTAAWRGLAKRDLLNISSLLRTQQAAAMADAPVFLASLGDGKSPLRLLKIDLAEDVVLCTVCGPSPSLEEAHGRVAALWKSPKNRDLLSNLMAPPPPPLQGGAAGKSGEEGEAFHTPCKSFPKLHRSILAFVYCHKGKWMLRVQVPSSSRHDRWSEEASFALEGDDTLDLNIKLALLGFCLGVKAQIEEGVEVTAEEAQPTAKDAYFKTKVHLSTFSSSHV